MYYVCIIVGCTTVHVAVQQASERNRTEITHVYITGQVGFVRLVSVYS